MVLQKAGATEVQWSAGHHPASSMVRTFFKEIILKDVFSIDQVQCPGRRNSITHLLQALDVRRNLFNCMFLKYTATFLCFTFSLLTLFSQPKPVTVKYDTCISIYYNWSCAEMIDSMKFNEKNTILENKSFDILKNANKYYLLKTVEHQQMDSTGELFFHNHVFKKILIDSFTHGTIDQNVFIQMEHEKIRPFAFEYKDATNKTIRVDGTSSHPCSVNLRVRFKGRMCNKWLDIRSLQQSDTTRGLDGRILITLENVNYEYNQRLLSTKILHYVQSVIAKFESENRFVLED